MTMGEDVSRLCCRFVVYKMHAGYSFFYMDVNNPSWVSGESVAEDSQAIGYTLQQVYKQRQVCVH